jgi:hypothetical protein
MRRYMRQPRGYSKDPDLICKVLKSFYGLKQAPRNWYGVLHDFLVRLGFSRCSMEYCLYWKKWEVNGHKGYALICHLPLC